MSATIAAGDPARGPAERLVRSGSGRAVLVPSAVPVADDCGREGLPVGWLDSVQATARNRQSALRPSGATETLIRSTSPRYAPALTDPVGAEPSATSKPTQQAPSPSLADLSGRVFRSSDLPELVPGSVPADVVVTMRFDKRGMVVADTGCNKLTGSARVKGGQLKVSQLAGTLIACDGSERAEQWLRDLLESAPEVSLSQNQLILDDGDVRLALDEETS
ncbi:MAG: META domain-containing protein [Nocardioidaceae bacterium]